MTAGRAARVPERLLARWIEAVVRYPAPVLALALALAGASLLYAGGNLSINTDTADMIDEELPFRQAVKEFKRTFPMLVDSLVVVIDGQTPDIAEDAAGLLVSRLRSEAATFKEVYWPPGDPYLVRHGLLYLDAAELDELGQNLAGVQPLLASLGEDPSLRGLFAQLTLAVDAMASGRSPPLDLTRAFSRLAEATESALEGRPYRLSWRELMTGETPAASDRRQIVILRPRLDFTRLRPGLAAIETTHRIAAELGLTPENGISVRLTGSVALEYQQLESAQRGARLAGPLSFALVALVLFMGMRSWRLVVASLVTLLFGLCWVAGFAALAIGELNLVSIAFAVLFIGLGIDFSIHVCLRYREIVAGGTPHREALVEAGRSAGVPLFLCAITTAAGFYVFVPTHYSGVSDLGVIAGTGMFISLAANLTVLPALLALLHGGAGGRVAGPLAASRLVTWLADAPIRHHKAVRVGAVAIAAATLFVIPDARFDFNPLNLHDQEAESLITFRDLLATSERSPWAAEIIADDTAGAEALAARLARLDVVGEVLTMADFIPGDQEDKLALIEEIFFFMGPPPAPGRIADPPDEAARRAALSAFREALDIWLADPGSETGLTASARRLRTALAGLETGGVPLEALERGLLGGLPGRLARLYQGLSATDAVTVDSLPEAIRLRYIAGDGRARITVFANGDLSDNAAMRRFADAVQGVAPRAVGSAVAIVESGDAVVSAFRQALLSAIVVVGILVLALFRSLRDMVLVLTLLGLAALLTVATSTVIDVPFNFANVIVLPLLLGIGVDAAIHLVHRHRTTGGGGAALLRTSTARAVIFSSLTTVCAFGSLIVSEHRGTMTMGLLLSIGVGFTILCTLVVLPAVLGKPASGPEAGTAP